MALLLLQLLLVLLVGAQPPSRAGSSICRGPCEVGH